MLGDGPIGVWATISLRRDGTLVLMDRGGHPTINPFINPDGEKNLYNSRHPADDAANYLGPWSKILENGGYTPDAAKAAALQVLPDILRYDRTKPATYPNGRVRRSQAMVFQAMAAQASARRGTTGLPPREDTGPILVAVDGYPHGWDALEWAAAEAAARACALRIVHVINWSPLTSDAFGSCP